MSLSALSALAVITLEFDPVVRIGELGVRLETIGIAVAVLVGLLGAATVARRVRDGVDGRPAPLVDIILLGIAAVPGAVVGGRLGYGLVHADYYAGHPGRLVDPSTGGFELTLAVVGGTLTAALFAKTLGGRIGTWLHVAALPLLAMLGLAKLATALGGTGQGAPFDGPFATAYLGAGPWGSLAPATPAWPSQLIEGLALVIGAAALVVLVTPDPEGRDEGETLLIAGARPTVPDGRTFFLALWIWASVRLFVGFTWRDAPVLGPLRAEQLLALGVAGASSFGFVVRARGGIRRRPRVLVGVVAGGAAGGVADGVGIAAAGGGARSGGASRTTTRHRSAKAKQPAAKPGASAASKPAAKPAAKPAGKPGASAASKPAGKPAAKPGASAAAKPAGKPAAKQSRKRRPSSPPPTGPG